MKPYAAVAICLLGLAFAAEDDSSRKSRQILHQLVPVIGDHSLYSYVQQPHRVAQHQPLNYAQPAVHSVVLPVQHPLPQPEFVQPIFQSGGPHVFSGHYSPSGSDHYNTGHYSPSVSGHYNSAHYSPSVSGHYNSGHYSPSVSGHYNSGPYSPVSGHYSQPASTQNALSPNHYSGHYQTGHELHHHQQQSSQQFGFPFRSRSQQQSSAPVNENSEQTTQFDSNGVSRNQEQPQPQSFQSLITPSQDSNEEQRFRSGTPQNQNFEGSSQQTSSQAQTSDSGQSQNPGEQSGLSAYRPSPRLYGPSPAVAEYPSQQRSEAGNPSSQPSQPPRQQQTFAFLPGQPDAQRSAQPSQQQQGQSTPIISQSGQIRQDGSYQYGFQSANGIQSTESGSMRPEGLYRYVEGSYSYTSPEGTPISARYYADETGFHVEGEHIPRVDASSGQQSTQLAVEAN